ncbi:hypothetical protein [Vibrio atlanticus]|uniref:Uncharacterized protein n=1 Tax=Vibrio atlanticus (strain LGP32) TaxID=575788 RepID=B7VI78_VIBA3|nr:hypothetical protein [Vibrio atlanticus]CAV17315.1 conserved hypothetical protein [Vibrio atlanticus]
MSWRGFTIDGQFYCLAHLQKKTIEVEIDSASVKLHLSYSGHCFTDDKENGPIILPRENRYWCHDRYELSKGLPDMIEQGLISSYAIPHFAGKNNEQYHYMEAFDYAIFFTVRKPNNTTNELNLRIASAYPVETWGKGSMPRGSAKRVSWILSKRLKGESVLGKKK